MHIICPHCTTFYGIDSSAIGEQGRTVRCSRCKKTWLVHTEDMISEDALMPMAAGSSRLAKDRAAIRQAFGQPIDHRSEEIPVVESPPIAVDPPAAMAGAFSDRENEIVWTAPSLDEELRITEQIGEPARPPRKPWLRRLRPSFSLRLRVPSIGLTTVCTAMAALVLAMMVWRVDIVRLLPQTAAFYKLVGLHVNVRGLAFKDVKVATESVEGKLVLVIEGNIVDEARKAVALPRLRFSVRDAQGAEIYAWNAVLEQSTLNPGEKAWFRSRLASPPPEGRHIDVRFFNKRDLAGVGA